ncbi:MAG: hypothetical protein SW833_21810 [Cyanobacteriota bacterium]|nr:hypothetical protein [Cyanobacteriota bacterium]
MNRLKWGWVVGAIALLSLGVDGAEALPGDRAESVLAWIKANPTLRSGAGDGFIVRRENTPAQRFRFQASVLAPGRITVPTNPGVIRSEQFEIVDRINGVPPQRLEESLRAIYGLDIYEDYIRSSIVYDYPNRDTLELARRQNLPSLGAQRGQLRSGRRFAYWTEITYSQDGQPLNGRVTVLLKEDLDKLAAELRDR